ncbi:MAG: hypothetical protein ACT4QD_04170, partial [Acidobacteriota bacterium]
PPPAVLERLGEGRSSVAWAAVEGAMVLIQLLLPTSGVAGAEAVAPLADTRRELAERFNGLTAYLRSPAKGLWTAPDGHTEQDDVVMVDVVTDTFDRPWWRTYAVTLAERFGQDTIHVRAVPVDMLDEGDQ